MAVQGVYPVPGISHSPSMWRGVGGSITSRILGFHKVRKEDVQTCQFPTQLGDSDLGHGGGEGRADTQEITPAAGGTCVQVLAPAKSYGRHLSSSFSVLSGLGFPRPSLPAAGVTYPCFGPCLRRGSWSTQPRAQRLPHQAACALRGCPGGSSSPPPDRMLAGRPRPALRAPGIDPSTPRPLRVSRSCTGQRHALLFPPPSCWASRDSLNLPHASVLCPPRPAWATQFYLPSAKRQGS